MYNNLHLLIPNFQSILALIPHLPRKASVPLIQISGCSIVASNPTPPPPPSLPPGTYCSSSWARGAWVPVCVCVCVCVYEWVTQACPTLWDSVDCSPSSSSVNETLQARILEWVAIPFSRDLPDPGMKPRCPGLQADSLLSGLPGSPCCDWRELMGKFWGYTTTVFSFLMT